MTVVVLGIDALDSALVDPDRHPNLALSARRAIDTIDSANGAPSTHELWPTIITGLPPSDHGLTLANDGVAWGNPVLDFGSRAADYLLPDALRTRLGAWLLTNTGADAFRTPASYYDDRGLSTLFDGRATKPIGIPNYVVDPDDTDREHRLRRGMGDLFERDPDAAGGHRSADPRAFYEDCLEMSMVRIARVRRALRAREYELAFGYTSGLDLIGHVAAAAPDLSLQERAYRELDEFVGELAGDLGDADELLLVSDHGLRDGVHTDEAMIAGTAGRLVADVGSVLDVRGAIEAELDGHDHRPDPERDGVATAAEDDSRPDSPEVRQQLEDLGYF